MYWDVLGYAEKRRAHIGIHWTDPVDPLDPVLHTGHALGYIGSHWDTLDRPGKPTGINWNNNVFWDQNTDLTDTQTCGRVSPPSY